MYLKSLGLTNFKNYNRLKVEFTNGIHCIVGRNGSGKTNLLDAIHYLSFTKSAFNTTDLQNISYGEDHFVIRGEFDLKGVERTVSCSFQNQKKSIRVDEKEQTKLSTHIGNFPVVLVGPNDIELIWNGSALRRKFFDSMISQMDGDYLQQLIIYTQTLRQRNGLLRMDAHRTDFDKDLLESYDQRLVSSGKILSQKRIAYLHDFLPLLKNHYRFLAGDSLEEVHINYKHEPADSDFDKLLKQNFQRDRMLQRTCSGLHRDDFIFLLDDVELKRFGSQGQQKSFLIALKLAEFQMIQKQKGFKPILLLDDIFDKLDDHRIQHLLALVNQQMFGQLFITDARPNRSKEIFAAAGVKSEIIQLQSGKIDQ